MPLEASEGDSYSLDLFLRQLGRLGRDHFTSNRLLVPALSIAGSLLHSGHVNLTAQDLAVAPSLMLLLEIATRSLDRIKSLDRLRASLSLLTAMMRWEPARSRALRHLTSLLTHQHVAVSPTLSHSFRSLSGTYVM